MINRKFTHVVCVKYRNPADVIQLATWCNRNLVFHTWTWGGGEFRFENESDAVQFALILD